MKYQAFISYSHRDAAWGDWLHKGLEHYKVPKPLVGVSTPRGESVPARIFPVFRDREELPTAVDLGEIINGALEQSRYLIVICSPSSAQSQWVNQEIIQFKRLGGENRVLAIIVAGEPNASMGKPGFTADQECFPEALRYKLGPNGRLSSEPTEPIAADARARADGKPNALLKLIAGVLGVNYDDLKRRDEVQRRRRQRVALAIVSSLAIVISGLAIVAWVQRGEAVEGRSEAERQRNEALVQKEWAEHHLKEALAQQGGNLLNQARARFATQRLTETNIYAGRALGSVKVSPGESRPLLEPGSAAHQAATLLKRSTDGMLVHQKSRDPLRSFPSFSTYYDSVHHRFFGEEKSTVYGYDLESGAEIWQVKVPPEKLVFLTASLDRDTLFALHGRGLTALDTSTGKVLRTVEIGPELDKAVGLVGSVGNTVIANLASRVVAIDTDTGKVQTSVDLGGFIQDTVLTFGGKSLLVADSGGEVSEFGLPELLLKRRFRTGEPGQSKFCNFTADGRFIATADGAGTIRRFNVQTGSVLALPERSQPTPLLALDYRSGRLHVIDRQGVLSSVAEDGALEAHLQIPVTQVTYLHVDRNRNHVLAIGNDATTGLGSQVYRAVMSGRFKNFLSSGGVTDHQFLAASCMHPGGLLMASDTPTQIMVRNAKSNEHGWIYKKNTGEEILDIAFSMEGFHIALLNRKGLIRVFDLRDLENPRIFQVSLQHMLGGEVREAPPFASNRLAFSADSTGLYVILGDGSIAKLNLANAEQEVVLQKPSVGVSPTMIAPANHPDQLFVCYGHELQIFDTRTRTFGQSITPGIVGCTDVTWDRENVYVAGSRDAQSVLVMLRREDYTPVAEVSGHQGLIRAVMRREDGNIILTGPDDQTEWNFASLRRREHTPPPDDLKRSGKYVSAPDGMVHLLDYKYADALLEVDPRSGRVTRILKHDGTGEPGVHFTRHRYAGENNQLLALSDKEVIYVFDRATFSRTAQFNVGGEVRAMSAAKNSAHLAVLTAEGVSRFRTNGERLWHRSGSEIHMPDRIETSDDDQRLVVNPVVSLKNEDFR